MRLSTAANTAIILFSYAAALCPQKPEVALVTTPVEDVAPPPSERFPARWYPPDTGAVPESLGPVLNAPYTAVSVTTATFLNPGTGETDVRVDKGFVARDSHGRTRVEDPPSGAVNGVRTHEVVVEDPVAHCSFRWSVPAVALADGPVAIVTCRPRRLKLGYADLWAQMNFTSVRDETRGLGHEHGQPLGKRMFGEVEAIGVHNTITRKVPATGELVTSGVEVWYSPSINEMVENRLNPAMPGGPPDYELTEIHLVEPDPALFYPPAPYRILTEAELSGRDMTAPARQNAGPSH